MAATKSFTHPVTLRRMQRQWSQAELARRAGIPRTTVGAIEGARLTPSVTGALALAAALDCSVEELFAEARARGSAHTPQWAFPPRTEPCRFWESKLGERRLLYPVEGLSQNLFPHDGVWHGGAVPDAIEGRAAATLVIACCDPAAGLLAHEYARASGFRLITLQRGSKAALDLLKEGLAHVAGLHRSTADQPGRNAETVRSQLGAGFQLLRVADWREGLALAKAPHSRSTRSIARGIRRWVLRETGSAARECLDELCATASGHTVPSHAAVAEAVRSGWAEAGVCVQLAAEDAGLAFRPIRTETLDFCFASSARHDPRIQALIRLLRNRDYRRLLGELPGYDSRQTGETIDAGSL